MAILKDSGTRRELSTGAMRDICEGKGRCDLLPLHQVIGLIRMSETIYDAPIAGVLEDINCFMDSGRNWFLYKAMAEFVVFELDMDIYQVILEVAKHFEDGAAKYGDDNWRKGIPIHCYLDSALRHYFKFMSYKEKWREAWPTELFHEHLDTMDEPHHRAFIWNLLCLIWTKENLPEMDDIHYECTIPCNKINDFTELFKSGLSDALGEVVNVKADENGVIVETKLNETGAEFIKKLESSVKSKNIYLINEDGTYE